MAEVNKNPFQIRQELLSTAKEYMVSMYELQQTYFDRQFYLAEEMMKKNSEEGMKLYQEAMNSTEKFYKNYPGVEQILGVAKQFQEFVDNKDKK
jgi:hypothetical protein